MVTLQEVYPILASSMEKRGDMQRRALQRASDDLTAPCVQLTDMEHLNIQLTFPKALVREALIKEKKKRLDRPKNEDLPVEFIADKKFVKVLLPALYQWAAALKDPWDVSASAMKNAIKVISRTYLGEDYEPSEDSPEVIKVSVRICMFKLLTILSYIGTAATSRWLARVDAIQRCLVSCFLFRHQ